MSIKMDIMVGLAVIAIIVVFIAIILASLLLALKGVGILMILFGIFMMFMFPSAGDIQSDPYPTSYADTGIIIGVIITIFGLVLLFV